MVENEFFEGSVDDFRIFPFQYDFQVYARRTHHHLKKEPWHHFFYIKWIRFKNRMRCKHNPDKYYLPRR